jgi:hypothetical protein
MKTVNDYLADGYVEVDRTLQRGYVSRTSDIGQREVCVAGGSRAGELYYDAPNWDSTRYCYRVYISK